MVYMLIVRIFSSTFEKWYYFLPLGWGVPIPIVAVSLGIRHEYYGTTSFCWLSSDEGVVWSFIGPMLAVILVNTVILILTVGSIIQVKRKANVNLDNMTLVLIVTSVKSTVVLLPLLGITWIIGLFAVNENTTMFAWIFTILNSLQGVMIFVLHILRNKKVRTKIMERCGLKRSTKKTNSVVIVSTEYTSTSKRDSKSQLTSGMDGRETSSGIHIEHGNCSVSPSPSLAESFSGDSCEH